MEKFPVTTNLFVWLAIFLFGLTYIETKDNSIFKENVMIDKASSQLVDYAAEHPISSAGFARNDFGCPIPSLTASLAVINPKWNLMLQDTFLINELASFARERIPERVVYAKGCGAYGYFRLTEDLSDLTKADFLNVVGKTTPVFVRFSRANGQNGSPDLIRDDRGFAIKFYTEDGIMDLVGNAAGVLPIRDPMLYGDMSRSRKLNPQTNLVDNTMRWDFDSLRPETILHTLFTFSDYAANYRVINGYGVHAFKFVDCLGKHSYVKFHLISQQPFRWFNATELVLVSGKRTDYAVRDLYNAIANNNYPKWTVKIQVMTQSDLAKYDRTFNPFDATIIWRQEDYPLRTIGEIVLNENPSNFFLDVEQAAFSPGNLVPGIEANPNDKLFHARMFSYPDAQRYRLGVNYPYLNVNKPKFPVKNYNRDGVMRLPPNGNGSPNYYPNSFYGPIANISAVETTFKVDGFADRIDNVDVNENFRLARLYVKELTPEKKVRLADNLGLSLAKALSFISERAIKNLFFRISDDFGRLVYDAWQKALLTYQS